MIASSPTGQASKPRYAANLESDQELGEHSAEASPFQPNTQLISQRKKLIIDQLRRELNFSHLTDVSEGTQAQVRARIREAVNLDPGPLSMMEKGILLQNILDELFGFGPLGPLLRDPIVGDICVNDIASVYVERHGRWEKASTAFDSLEQLRQVIDNIIHPHGVRLDVNSPIAEVRLANGSRVIATIPPVSTYGPTLTIRGVRINVISLGELVEKGALSVQMAEVLKACVKARVNIIVSGHTDAGKTTLLNALSTYIGPNERIITIEEASELRFQHAHWVALETPPPSLGRVTEVARRSLLATALRMRSDRIILGECSLAEALDVLGAMSTGHSGTMTSICAPSVAGCLERLETGVLMAGGNMPVEAARRLIASTGAVLVQLNRLEDGTRRITEISEITGVDDGAITASTLFHLERGGRDPRGFFKCRHIGSEHRPNFLAQIERELVPFKMEWLK